MGSILQTSTGDRRISEPSTVHFINQLMVNWWFGAWWVFGIPLLRFAEVLRASCAVPNAKALMSTQECHVQQIWRSPRGS